MPQDEDDMTEPQPLIPTQDAPIRVTQEQYQQWEDAGRPAMQGVADWLAFLQQQQAPPPPPPQQQQQPPPTDPSPPPTQDPAPTRTTSIIRQEPTVPLMPTDAERLPILGGGAWEPLDVQARNTIDQAQALLTDLRDTGRQATLSEQRLLSSSAEAIARLREEGVPTGDGRRVNVDDYLALTPEQRRTLAEEGVEGLERRAERDRQAFERDHVQTADGQWIPRADFAALPPQQQELLRTQGFQALLNAQQQALGQLEREPDLITAAERVGDQQFARTAALAGYSQQDIATVLDAAAETTPAQRDLARRMEDGGYIATGDDGERVIEVERAARDGAVSRTDLQLLGLQPHTIRDLLPPTTAELRREGSYFPDQQGVESYIWQGRQYRVQRDPTTGREVVVPMPTPQERADVLVGVTPVVGTIVHWNRMGPGWRALSIAGDLGFFFGPAVARAALRGAATVRRVAGPPIARFVADERGVLRLQTPAPAIAPTARQLPAPGVTDPLRVRADQRVAQVIDLGRPATRTEVDSTIADVTAFLTARRPQGLTTADSQALATLRQQLSAGDAVGAQATWVRLAALPTTFPETPAAPPIPDAPPEPVRRTLPIPDDPERTAPFTPFDPGEPQPLPEPLVQPQPERAPDTPPAEPERRPIREPGPFTPFDPDETPALPDPLVEPWAPTEPEPFDPSTAPTPERRPLTTPAEPAPETDPLTDPLPFTLPGIEPFTPTDPATDPATGPARQPLPDDDPMPFTLPAVEPFVEPATTPAPRTDTDARTETRTETEARTEPVSIVEAVIEDATRPAPTTPTRPRTTTTPSPAPATQPTPPPPTGPPFTPFGVPTPGPGPGRIPGPTPTPRRPGAAGVPRQKRRKYPHIVARKQGVMWKMTDMQSGAVSYSRNLPPGVRQMRGPSSAKRSHRVVKHSSVPPKHITTKMGFVNVRHSPTGRPPTFKRRKRGRGKGRR